jgi:tripartite-type tricarboxylate transporter receptor subunit TctC
MSFSSNRRSLVLLAAGLPALAGLGRAQAQQQQRVIRMVVPFGTGAVQDTVARAFNSELGAALNASVIVENRAGAGGTVGAALVAKAPADGNTLILAAASHHIAGHLYNKLPYDPLKDFVGVAEIGNAGYVVVASSDLKVANTAEFIREVKAHPGKYNYASAGNGSATHLAMASFLAKAGLQMTHIPMKSTGEAVNELLAGRVQAVTSSSIGVMGLQSDARIKPLASTGKVRSPFLPNLPTAHESGLPGYEFDSWIGVLAPAGTPPAIVSKINADINAILQTPEFRDALAKQGNVAAQALTPAQFSAKLSGELKAFEAVAAKIDLSAN